MTDAELVREVAEKVMKAKDIVFTPFGECHIIDKDNIWMTFDPIHDLNHAFMVVGKMREWGWSCHISYPSVTDEKKIAVQFRTHRPYCNYASEKEEFCNVHQNPYINSSYPKYTEWVYEDSLGRAICLAALKAVEE